MKRECAFCGLTTDQWKITKDKKGLKYYEHIGCPFKSKI